MQGPSNTPMEGTPSLNPALTTNAAAAAADVASTAETGTTQAPEKFNGLEVTVNAPNDLPEGMKPNPPVPTPEQQRAPLPANVKHIQSDTEKKFERFDRLRETYLPMPERIDTLDSSLAPIQLKIEEAKNKVGVYLKHSLTTTTSVPVTEGRKFEKAGKLISRKMMSKRTEKKSKPEEQIKKLAQKGKEIREKIQPKQDKKDKIVAKLAQFQRIHENTKEINKLISTTNEKQKQQKQEYINQNQILGEKTKGYDLTQLKKSMADLSIEINELTNTNQEALDAYDTQETRANLQGLRQESQNLLEERIHLTADFASNIGEVEESQKAYQESLTQLASAYLQQEGLPSKEDIPNERLRQDVIQEMLSQYCQSDEPLDLENLTPAQIQFNEQMAENYFELGSLPLRPPEMKNPIRFELVLGGIAQKCLSSPNGFVEEASEGSGEVYFLGKQQQVGDSNEVKNVKLFVWKPTREAQTGTTPEQVIKEQWDVNPPEEDSKREYIGERLSGSSHRFAYSKLQKKSGASAEGYLSEFIPNAGSIMNYSHVLSLTQGKIKDVNRDTNLSKEQKTEKIGELNKKQNEIISRGETIGFNQDTSSPSGWTAFKNLSEANKLDLQRQAVRNLKLGNHDQNLGNILVQTKGQGKNETISRFVTIDPARCLGKIPYRFAQQHLFQIPSFDSVIDPSIAKEEILNENMQETWLTLQNLQDLMPQAEETIQLNLEGLEFNIAHRLYLKAGCENDASLNEILKGFDMISDNSESRDITVSSGETLDVNLVRFFYETAKAQVNETRAVSGETSTQEGPPFPWDQKLWDSFQILCNEHFSKPSQ